MVVPVAAGAAGAGAGGAAAGSGAATSSGAGGAASFGGGGFGDILGGLFSGGDSSKSQPDFSEFNFPDLIAQLLGPTPLKEATSEFGRFQAASGERQNILATLATLGALQKFGGIFEQADPEVINAILAPQESRAEAAKAKPKEKPKIKGSTSIGEGRR